MNDKLKIIVAILIALVVGFGFGRGTVSSGVGGTTNFDAIELSEGLTVTGATTLSGATTVGALTITGAVAQSGATVLSTLTQGGGCSTVATTSATYTLLASQMDVENCVDVTMNGGTALTLSLMASSTFPLGTTAGDSRQFVIRNATTTASTTIILAGGTGVTLKSASSTKTIYGDTDGNNTAVLTAVRKSNSDIVVDADFYAD